MSAMNIKAMFVLGSLLALGNMTAAGRADSILGREPTGKIHGTVVKMERSMVGNRIQPISGASVFLFKSRSDKVLDRTITNRNGEFSFSSLAPGEYLLVAKKADEGTARSAVQVREGEAVKTLLVLQ